MKTFNDLTFKACPYGGIQAIEFFQNGYGISVIQTPFSYGNDEGFYECAVLELTENSWCICYDTPIADDVVGYCTKEDVSKIMKQIQELN